MKIRQLAVSYLAEQDRILLRLNTAGAHEIRLWLTRRLMVGLGPLLQRLQTRLVLQRDGNPVEDEDLKRMLADFRMEQLLLDADFETPYADKPAALPLGARPLLVTDVDAELQAGGRLRLSLNEQLPGKAKPRSFAMTLEPRLALGLVRLLEQAVERANWRAPMEGQPALPEEAAEPGGDGTRRGRWLN
ncbi:MULTISPECIES: hypothetical protein [Ramlibacter]|uniref:DUF748 domain-containing protein n=1 Tax=Ramlibacter aquaticus TaxID=2780094 RepID=A0ABR9SD31_9BURK|nr:MULTISPECIES: hypothetical protein [Ramlibacter]MBE7939967.1 hypothetical protein [Ramlibacter aquaticus]